MASDATRSGIVNEGVHDGHGTAGDTSLWVNLLQYFVDVRAVTLDPLSSALSTFEAFDLALLLEFLDAVFAIVF